MRAVNFGLVFFFFRINALNLFSAEASQSLFSWLPQGEERLPIKNAYVLSYCLAHLT